MSHSRKSSGRPSLLRASVQQARESLKPWINPYTEEELQWRNERSWRWSYLKTQFQGRNLEDLFILYNNKINHGYFSLFLILQFVISSVHFAIVLYTNAASGTLDHVILDLILYGVIAFPPIIGLLISESYIKKHPHALKIVSAIAFALLYIVDVTLPIYHSSSQTLRPAYTTHLILACYIFFNFPKTVICIILGVGATCTHILVLALITYKDLNTQYNRLIADALYLLCVNGLGLYFRFANEIVIRKSFLDRRDCVESTLQLKYEKDQEEQLLLTIIPENILNDVRQAMDEYIRIILERNVIPKPSSFLRSYDDVTILYADIVNYTVMTSKLKPVTKLVETLNELFGRFDDASEKLNVLRIKFLGDCYYCISGLPPNRTEAHAEACVDLGIKMISIIRSVREHRQLQIDMRIGIHTGSIVSGLIGLRKWQFDIWSKDVYIANKMESTGKAGKIHISEQTRSQLRKPYNIVKHDAGSKDPMLKQYNIETYLISPEDPAETKPNKASPNQLKRLSVVSEGQNQAETGEDNEMKTEKSEQTNKKQMVTTQKSFIEEVKEAALNEPTVENNNNVKGVESANFKQNVRRGSLIPNNNLGRRLSGNPNRYQRNLSERRYTPDVKRRTAFMDNHIHRYHERLKETEMEVKETINNMPLSKYDQWFKVKEVQPLLLLFRDLKLETKYILKPDPLFKYYIFSQVLVLVSMIVIHHLTLPDWQWTSIFAYSTLGTIIIIFIPLTWTNPFRIRDFEVTSEKAKTCLHKCSSFIIDSVVARTIIYLLLSVVMAGYIITELNMCNSMNEIIHDDDGKMIKRFLYYFYGLNKSGNPVTECIIPWHMTQICSLAIIMSFVFLRIHLWLKVIYALVVTIYYSYSILYFSAEVSEEFETYNYMMQPALAQVIGLIHLSFILHLIDRQTDYMNRLDFLWSEKLKTEQKKANLKHTVNATLLHNILPKHVAELYLNVERESNGLYYEEYTNVAVIFASIVDYSLDNIDENYFLKVMNDIIVDFDNLLYTHKKIEKIKIANWTYMAACGLCDGQETTESNEHVVVTLLKFVVAMMNTLNKINRSLQQNFKLRIGLSHGEVTAGVVGSKKPLYDIWGDTVNMASRMDSTGISGQIQITEKSAQVLKEQGYACEFRDYIFVKGKSENGLADVPTYLVSLKNVNQTLQLITLPT